MTDYLVKPVFIKTFLFSISELLPRTLAILSGNKIIYKRIIYILYSVEIRIPIERGVGKAGIGS